MSAMKPARLATTAAVIVLVAAAAACSGDGDDDATGAGGTAEQTQTDVEPGSQTTSGADGDGTAGGADSGSGKDAGSDGDSGSDKESDGSDGDGTVAADQVAPPNDEDVTHKGDSQSPVLNEIPGNDDHACVDTTGKRDVRSGGMAAGPFDEARASYGERSPGKAKGSIRLYWIPRHGANPGDLTVRVTRVGGGSSTTLSQATVGDAEQWSFYDTNVPIAGKGTWRLQATSGPDRGCFDVTIG